LASNSSIIVGSCVPYAWVKKKLENHLTFLEKVVYLRTENRKGINKMLNKTYKAIYAAFAFAMLRAFSVL